MNDKTGTNSVDDLKAVRYASAADFGLDTINRVLQADLDFHNGQRIEMLAGLAEPLTEQQRVFGTNGYIEQVELDEFGNAATRKLVTGETVAFPLRSYGSAWGATQKYLQIATPAEIAEKYLQIQTGAYVTFNKNIQRAIYNNANYSFVDKLTNGVTLAVKRLVNADGMALPSFGTTTFDGSTHQHYSASTPVSNTNVDALVSNVVEHGHTRGVKLVISLTNKAAVIALTNFKALNPAGLSNVLGTAIRSNDVTAPLNDRLIGYWVDEGTEVWVKPWAVANYILCYADTGEKLLGFRQRPQTQLQGLRLAAEMVDFPLMAKNFEYEYGFGVWNRTAGAVLYIGAANWANPTIS
jgi:hypothetical protein